MSTRSRFMNRSAGLRPGALLDIRTTPGRRPALRCGSGAEIAAVGGPLVLSLHWMRKRAGVRAEQRRHAWLHPSSGLRPPFPRSAKGEGRRIPSLHST